MPNDLDFEKDIQIDIHNLDKELEIQSSVYYKYSKHITECRRVMDESKSRLSLIKAEMDKSIRDNPEKFGLTKTTESAINSAVLMTNEYQTAESTFNKASYDFNMALSAVQALEHKRTAMSDLVKLHAQNYYSVAGGCKIREESKEKAIKERMAEKQKTTSKRRERRS